MSLTDSTTLPPMNELTDPSAAPPSSQYCCVKSALWATPFLLLSLLMTVAFIPSVVTAASLDISYQFCIDYAVVHHWRFGTQFLGTFGPWGFAYNNIYHPQLMGWMIAAQVMIGIGMFAGVWAIAKNLRIHPLIAGIWLIAITVWDFMAFDDGRILAMCLLPMLIRRTNFHRRDSAGSYVVATALALAGLCKFTFLTLSGGAIGLLVIEDLLEKRVPKLGLWFAAMILVLWRVAGQGLSDLPTYLISAWKLASGYSAAMGAAGPDFFMIPTVIVISAIIATLIFARFWRDSRVGAVFAFLTTAATLFIGFKEGFVRYDGHELAATITLVLVSLICAPVLWLRWFERPPLLAVLFVRALVIALVCSSLWCLAQGYDRFLPGAHLFSSLEDKPPIVEDRLFTSWNWLMNGDRIFDANYDAGLIAARDSFPFPPVTGTVDMYGFNQAAVIAAGMDYHPRPVAPGFQAWSPYLIETNRRSLLSDQAPENIFFMPAGLDNRFPALDDGALWPILLSHYSPTEITPTGYLVLHRAAQPRTFSLTLLSSQTYKIGEHIPVPDISDGAVFVKIKLTQTLLGKLGTALLRMPEVYLDYKTLDGNTNRRRLIPGIAEAGFIVSPVVNDSFGFLSLMSHTSHLPSVKDIAVNVRYTGGLKKWFNPDIQVTFEKLTVEPFNLHDAPVLDAMGNLAELSLTAQYPSGTAFFNAPDNKQALLAHAPMHMRLVIPPGATHLHLSYGIRPEAQDKTNGVIFIITARKPGAPDVQLFTQTLQPQTVPNDRPQHYTDIPLPPGCSQLTFETRPATTVTYDWSYWSDVRFN